MRIDVVTIFQPMFSAVTEHGIPGRAIAGGFLEVNTWNPRNFTDNRHRTVDDRPYGGGPGMVMLAEPLYRAIRQAKQQHEAQARVIYLSPQGSLLTDAKARELATLPGLILLAGRYEGIDERLLETEVDEEISIGDFVLCGGEIAAMALIEAVVRHLPGVLGNADSAEQESFVDGLLDCPHYTRPEVFADKQVPEVLLSGDHAAIRRWRLKQALGRTWRRRPDLLSRVELTAEQRDLLMEYQGEFAQTNVAD